MSTSSSSSSKHKSDIGYGHPNHPHQGSGGSSSSITNPYSHGTNGGPPPLLPNMQLPPPPQPSSHNPPLKHQSQERLKKCKAVFGQGQKELWCNKCRWKKKCIRFEYYSIIRSTLNNVLPSYHNGMPHSFCVSSIYPDSPKLIRMVGKISKIYFPKNRNQRRRFLIRQRKFLPNITDIRTHLTTYRLFPINSNKHGRDCAQ